MPAAEELDEDMEIPDESPILKVGEEKEIGKQGLKKKLVKEGEGWETPENGDEVEGNWVIDTCSSTVGLMLPVLDFICLFVFVFFFFFC